MQHLTKDRIGYIWLHESIVSRYSNWIGHLNTGSETTMLNQTQPSKTITAQLAHQAASFSQNEPELIAINIFAWNQHLFVICFCLSYYQKMPANISLVVIQTKYLWLVMQAFGLETKAPRIDIDNDAFHWFSKEAQLTWSIVQSIYKQRCIEHLHLSASLEVEKSSCGDF